MSLAPYRIAQAPEPEAPEEDDAPFAAALRRRARRSQLAAAACGVVIVMAVYAGMAHGKISSASRWADAARAQEAARSAHTHAVLAKAERKANTAQKGFEDALRNAVATDALAGPARTITTSTCPVALPRETGIIRGRSAFPLVIASRTEVEDARVTSPTVALVRRDIEAAVAHDANSRSEVAAHYADALERASYRFDVVFVTDKRKDPAVTSTTSYEPGEAAGRVYVYDFGSQRIVCSGDVRATSSKELGYAYASEPDAPRALERRASLEATLFADFRWQIERSIVGASLRAL